MQKRCEAAYHASARYKLYHSAWRRSLHGANVQGTELDSFVVVADQESLWHSSRHTSVDRTSQATGQTKTDLLGPYILVRRHI
jgi:hypothetical protein